MAESKAKTAAKKSGKDAAEPSTPKTKAATPKTAAKPKAASTATKTPRAKKSATPQQPVSGEERYKMTEVAAYYIAQRNGFAGDAKTYWAEAEIQIEQMLQARSQ